MSDTETPSPSSAGEKPVVNAAKAPVRPQLRTGPSNPNMNGPLYMQSGSNVVLVRRLKQKDLSTSARLSRWFIENQIGRLQMFYFPFIALPGAGEFFLGFALASNAELAAQWLSLPFPLSSAFIFHLLMFPLELG